jgi:hypothetical protein
VGAVNIEPIPPNGNRHRHQTGVNEASGGVLVGAPVYQEDATAQGCSKAMATSDADQRAVGDERPRCANERARAGEASRFVVCGSHKINGDHQTPHR